MRAGSLQNMLYDEAAESATPKVGDGVTVCGWTDRHPGTIIAVSKSGKSFTFQYDKATRTDSNGMSDAQAYSFEADPEGRTEIATCRKDGAYRVSGGQSRVLLGVRMRYFDFSF